jgi:hypothetical protein
MTLHRTVSVVLTVFNLVSLQLQVQLLPNVSAYVTSGLPGHKHRAWLKKMTTDICELPPGNLSPEDCVTTPLILHAWAKNPWMPHQKSSNMSNNKINNVYPHHGKECALVCEQLLKRLVDERRAGNTNAVASTQTYNALINVWSKSGEKGGAAQRAEQIVVGMQDAYAYGEIDVQPDLESFRLVLRAWSQAKGEENAPHRAQQILDWMNSLYESGENTLAQPDADCYDIVLHTWAMSGHSQAPHRTEELIMSMDNNENAKPTLFSYNQVLTAWSKVQGIEAAQRADAILRHMIEIGKTTSSNLTPNIVSYSAVISAWSKSRHEDRGRRAERILKLAEKHHKKTSEEVRLDNVIYNLVIDAHAKTSSNKSHIRARAVLDRLIAQHGKGLRNCKPDVYSFSSVLSSCSNLSASKRDRLQAFYIAKFTFDEMLKFGVEPNHVSYGIMLKACARLIPMGKERNKYVREYFRAACKDGCVGGMVLDRLKGATSRVQYEALLNGNKENSLPAEWTSKAPANEKYKRGNGYKKRRATV